MSDYLFECIRRCRIKNRGVNIVIQKTEERFEYKGFPCVILFMTLGHRCGYVGVLKGNTIYGQCYDEIPINCHGGLTYSSSELQGQTDKDIWWIGFDTAHYGDGKDFETAKEIYKYDMQALEEIKTYERLDRIMSDGAVRDLDYCKNECKKIVDQLIELGIEHGGK